MATAEFFSAPPIQSKPEFAGILREDEIYAPQETEDVGGQINSWFDNLMLQSGLEIAPSFMLLICMSSAVLLAGLVFVLQENLLTTALAGVLGMLLPIFYAVYARSSRQKLIMEQMPGMIEELARAARTGRSLEQSFALVAEDTPAPLGRELRLAGRKMQMGLPIRDALNDLPERTGLVSLNVFAMALAIHQETGGDLVRVLDRLAGTIRDRMLFLGRLRAATTASRATAILMISLPPAIIAFFMFRDPGYLNDLMASSWGRTSTIIAIALQIIGSLWIVRILKNSQRT